MLQSFQVDALQVEVYATEAKLDTAAADYIIQTLRALTPERLAAVIFATGSTPLGLLQQLQDRRVEINWPQVIGLHLDEYLGIDPVHPASFQRYLRTRLGAALPFKAFHYLNSQALEPVAECDRYTHLLKSHTLDLCLLGIGNNGHLAFNDPTVADPHDSRWVKLVQLDEENRQQQFQSGHFPSADQVPRYAYTLTLPAIFAARARLCLAKGDHKAAIVQQVLQGAVTPACPASFLRHQARTRLLLDAAAAARL